MPASLHSTGVLPLPALICNAPGRRQPKSSETAETPAPDTAGTSETRAKHAGQAKAALECPGVSASIGPLPLTSRPGRTLGRRFVGEWREGPAAFPTKAHKVPLQRPPSRASLHPPSHAQALSPMVEVLGSGPGKCDKSMTLGLVGDRRISVLHLVCPYILTGGGKLLPVDGVA